VLLLLQALSKGATVVWLVVVGIRSLSASSSHKAEALPPTLHNTQTNTSKPSNPTPHPPK
jgi:hypothetical protein